jgi:hypothetical protein
LKSRVSPAGVAGGGAARPHLGSGKGVPSPHGHRHGRPGQPSRAEDVCEQGGALRAGAGGRVAPDGQGTDSLVARTGGSAPAGHQGAGGGRKHQTPERGGRAVPRRRHFRRDEGFWILMGSPSYPTTSEMAYWTGPDSQIRPQALSVIQCLLSFRQALGRFLFRRPNWTGNQTASNHVQGKHQRALRADNADGCGCLEPTAVSRTVWNTRHMPSSAKYCILHCEAPRTSGSSVFISKVQDPGSSSSAHWALEPCITRNRRSALIQQTWAPSAALCAGFIADPGSAIASARVLLRFTLH